MNSPATVYESVHSTLNLQVKTACDFNRQLLCSSVCVCLVLSHVRLFVTPWTVPRQAPLSKLLWDFPDKNAGDLLNSVIEPAFPALAGGFFITEAPGKPLGNGNTTCVCLVAQSRPTLCDLWVLTHQATLST